MRIKSFNIILLLIIIYPYTANSQSNCTVPLSPVLISVSVQPETSKTEFHWAPAETTNIAGYIIYSFKDGDGTAIDTIWDPLATSHIITNTAPKYSSVSYVVAAHRLSSVPGMPGCTSPLSNVLATIFSEASIDTCNKKISLSWNKYIPQLKAVTNYSVMMSVNGGAYTVATVTGPDLNSFTLDDFTTDADYCFYVTANVEDGSSSTSNKTCVHTSMQRPPDWINADFASVNSGNKIVLSFTVDPLSQITDFLLERKTGESGSFEPVANFKSDNAIISYTDTKADFKKVNFYRLSAINSCHNPITVSNLASNMFLTLNNNGKEYSLSWNPYMEWMGTVSDYRLMVDTGNGFTEKGVVGPADTSYTLDYKDIMYEVSASEICMYILASETSNPHNIEGMSASSVACTGPTEIVTVPNIFTPNNDLINDLFKPILSFIPTSYHLIISDRHGTVIFESKDSAGSWDGTGVGKPEPDGVYLWFLKVTTPSGKELTKTGTVTILKNP